MLRAVVGVNVQPNNFLPSGRTEYQATHGSRLRRTSTFERKPSKRYPSRRHSTFKGCTVFVPCSHFAAGSLGPPARGKNLLLLPSGVQKPLRTSIMSLGALQSLIFLLLGVFLCLLLCVFLRMCLSTYFMLGPLPIEGTAFSVSTALPFLVGTWAHANQKCDHRRMDAQSAGTQFRSP